MTRLRLRPLPLLATALLLAGGSLSCRPAPASPPSAGPPPPLLDVGFEALAVLGAGESGLGAPRAVRTGPGGEVYVADALATSVKVYAPDGKLLRTIGRRGREPGELLSLQAIALTPAGDLLASDPQSRRIHRFSPDGKLAAFHDLGRDLPAAPGELHALPEGGVLATGPVPSLERPRNFGRRPAPGPLLHLLDPAVSTRTASFLEPADLLPDGAAAGELDEIVAQVDPGSLWVTPDGALLVAPSMYRGEIERYERRDGQWRRTRTYDGWVAELPPYRAADPEARDPRELNLVTRGRHDPIGAVFHNESRGLFVLSDGRMVHFSLAKQGDERVFGVEVFDPAGRLVGYGPLERVPHPADRASQLPLYVEWKDAEDRFYLRDERDLPVIRVVTLAIGAGSDPPLHGETGP